MQDYQNRSEKRGFSFRREKWYDKDVFYFLLLLAEIIILFLLSRALTKNLSRFMSANWMSVLFLPGVIVHELSHLFVAAILLVPVGEMEFVPKKNNNEIKLGSVEIAKTDPIRRSIIGFAPFFAGLTIVITIVYFFNLNLVFFQNKNIYIFIAAILALIYLLFAISNTMFSSSRDLEGTAEVLLALLLIFAGAYVLGFHPSLVFLNTIFNKEFLGILQKSTLFLLAPVTIDLILLGIIRLFSNSRSRI